MKAILEPEDEKAPFVAFLEDVLNGKKDNDYPFIICFTKTNVSDYIWEKYGDHGKGVSLQIDLNMNHIEVMDNPFLCCSSPKLFDCHYWDRHDIKKQFLDKHPYYLNEYNHKPLLVQDFISIASLIKSPVFLDDNETRIVVFSHTLNVAKTDEKGRRYIVLRVPVSDLKEIVIGPAAGKEDVASIKRLIGEIVPIRKKSNC